MKILFEKDSSLENQIIIDSTKNLKKFLKENNLNSDIFTDKINSEGTLVFPNNKYGLFCFNKGHLVFPIAKIIPQINSFAILFYIYKLLYEDIFNQTFTNDLYYWNVEIVSRFESKTNDFSSYAKDINSAYSYCLTKAKQFSQIKEIDRDKLMSFIERIRKERLKFKY